MAETSRDMSWQKVDDGFFRHVFKANDSRIPQSEDEFQDLDDLFAQENDNPTPGRLSSLPPSSPGDLPPDSDLGADQTSGLEFPPIPSHLASPIYSQELLSEQTHNTPIRRLDMTREPVLNPPDPPSFSRSREGHKPIKTRSVFIKPHEPLDVKPSPKTVKIPKKRTEHRIKSTSLWSRGLQLVSTVMQVTAVVVILTVAVLFISTYIRSGQQLPSEELSELLVLREETTMLRAALDTMAGRIENIAQHLPDPKFVKEWDLLQKSKNWADAALDAEIIPSLTTPPYDPTKESTAWTARLLTKLFPDVDFALDPQSLLIPRSNMCWPVGETGGSIGVRLGSKVVLESVEVESQHPLDTDVYFIDDNKAVVHAGSGTDVVPVRENSGVQSLVIKVRPSQATCVYRVRAIGRLA